MMSAFQEQKGTNAPLGSNNGTPALCSMFAPKLVNLPGMWKRPQNVFYKTSNSEYGRLRPTIETIPVVYHPKSYKFSRHMLMYGMYQNNSFNVVSERSRVCDYPNFQHTI